MTQWAQVGNTPVFKNAGARMTRTYHAGNYKTFEDWRWVASENRLYDDFKDIVRTWNMAHPDEAVTEGGVPVKVIEEREARKQKQTQNQTQTTSSDVLSSFNQALDTLRGGQGDAERLYQQGRRQALGQAAISAINAGAGNIVNMPAMGIAYDEANRPAFNVQQAQAVANVLQNLGQTQASMRATDIGAATSRYATDVGAQTSRYAANVSAGTAASGQALDYAASQAANQTALITNQANLALQKYIADLNASVRMLSAM